MKKTINILALQLLATVLLTSCDGVHILRINNGESESGIALADEDNDDLWPCEGTKCGCKNFEESPANPDICQNTYQVKEVKRYLVTYTPRATNKKVFDFDPSSSLPPISDRYQVYKDRVTYRDYIMIANKTEMKRRYLTEEEIEQIVREVKFVTKICNHTARYHKITN